VHEDLSSQTHSSYPACARHTGQAWPFGLVFAWDLGGDFLPRCLLGARLEAAVDGLIDRAGVPSATTRTLLFALLLALQLFLTSFVAV